LDIDSKNIQSMFNSISKRYDLLNTVLSFAQDKRWRKRTIQLADLEPNHTVLDLATGTADMIDEIIKQKIVKDIIGTDFSIDMLKHAKKKIKTHKFIAADAHHLPFKPNIFDRIFIAFGFRNMINKEKVLLEIHNILKANGKLIILEFSEPTNKIFAMIYRFYFKNILPLIGKLVSGNSNAYTYLPESVYKFPKRDILDNMFRSVGFRNISFTPLTLGIVTIIIAQK